MNDPRDKFGLYWLQTIAPFGLSGLPSPYPPLLPSLASAKPSIPPWETPRFSDRAIDAPSSSDTPWQPSVNGGILGPLSRPDGPPLFDSVHQEEGWATWGASMLPTLTPIFPSTSAPRASVRGIPFWLQTRSPFGSPSFMPTSIDPNADFSSPTPSTDDGDPFVRAAYRTKQSVQPE